MNEIDLTKAEKEFEIYTNLFMVNNPDENNKGKIQLKIEHTYRVEKLCIEIAKWLGLSEEHINLAGLVGLLHDIGRFEQLKRYNTYNDRESIDHADFGEELLMKDGLIRKFIKKDTYDRIISNAVKFHNKYNIPENLTDPDLMYLKIVRDADKIDILNLLRYKDFRLLYKNPNFEGEKVSDKVFNTFLKHKTINFKDMETTLDRWTMSFAFPFDINYSYSLKVIKENDYINELIDRVKYKDPETKQRIEIIRKEIIEYIETKIKQ